MGGGRKKKDKEQSFKRSDSFKRISIRKNYLDRGKKKQQLQKIDAANRVLEAERIGERKIQIVEETEPRIVSENIYTKAQDQQKVTNKQKTDEHQQGNEYVDYDSHDRKKNKRNSEVSLSQPVRRSNSHAEVTESQEDLDPAGPSSLLHWDQWAKPREARIKMGCREKIIIHVPASEDMPVPAVRTKMRTYEDRQEQMQREIITAERSPEPPRRRDSRPSQANKGDDLCALSVSLGRIWMEAPLAMAPRSLELPRPPTASSVALRTTHLSLDSALKGNKDESPVTNGLQKQLPRATVIRALSDSAQESSATSSQRVFSSKDSGFSLSIPKLTEFSPTNGAFPAQSAGGFFKKTKRPKPKPSVSRDGYFKRTSGASEARPVALRRSSTRSKRRRPRAKADDRMYQVVVNRPPRSLAALRLDPMIFVAPEKRDPTARRKPSFANVLPEVRDVPINPVAPDTDTDEGLYECISAGECASDTPESGRMSRLADFPIDDDFYQFPSSDFLRLDRTLQDKLDELSLSESVDFTPAHVSKIANDLDRSISSLSLSPTPSGGWSFSTASSNLQHRCRVLRNSDFFEARSRSPSPEYSAIDESIEGAISLPVIGISPVPKRRQVRRRKSTVTYLPRGLHRAPATLRRNKSRLSK